MRSFLMAAALLSLMAARTVAEPATCAILFRDVDAVAKAAGTAAAEFVAPQNLVPAFRSQHTFAKTNSTSAASLSRWLIATYSSTEERDTAMAILRQHRDIEHVEAIRQIPIPGGLLSAPLETPWNVDAVRAPQALQQVQADSSLIVAVIDTGADLTHPDLMQQLWDSGDAAGNATTADDAIDQNGDGVVEEWEKHDDDNNGYVDDEHGYDFTDAPGQGGVGDDQDRDPDPQDDHGHGTHVAGIIAAHGTLEGVAPFVRLMPVRAAYTTGFGGGILETDDAAAAIVYAVDNGAHVLNLSWGDTVASRLIAAAIDHAIQHQVLVVAAAGNDGEPGAHWPAADPRVIGVGSHMRSGERSNFSNFDVGVDLLAPGEEAPFPGQGIVSLEPLDLVAEGRGSRRGTSMAAPHVAGVAAIVMSRADHPDMPTVRALLLDSAQRSGPTWSSGRGHGRVDALAAVQQSSSILAIWHGPSAPYLQGRVRATGTVWGGAVQRFQVLAQHAALGTQVLLRPWEAAFYWQQQLVDRDFVAPHQGAWHLILQVEDTGGVVHERRMRMDVDDTTPQLDSLFVNPVWRGPQPRWLLSASWDEAVSVQVRRDGSTVYSNAGLAALHHQEIVADASLAGVWDVGFQNAAGFGDSLQQQSPLVLEAWQPAADLRAVSESSDFLPQSTWGATPLGRMVVWGQGHVAGVRGFLQARQVVNDILQTVFESSERGRPVSYGDINGDLRADLLVQDGLRAKWMTTCDTCEFPLEVLAEVTTERVLGLFQLDADPALETILSTRDSLLLFDDAVQGPPVLLQVIANPVTDGFNFWGADAVVSDLDADHRIELVCGDGEGNVSVFEAEPGQAFVLQQIIDTNGSYAYDLTALPPDGFLVGRQRTSSVTGDGFGTTSYEFLRYEFGAGEFALEDSWPFASPTGDLNAGSSLIAGNPPMLLLARGDDLYVQQQVAGAWQQGGWLAGADGEPPVVGDLQGNGALTWVLPTRQGARVLVSEPLLPAFSVETTSLGAGRLALSWQPGDGSNFRVRRRAGQEAWQTLVETMNTTWIDSTAVAYVDHEYEVQTLAANVVAATSSRVLAHSQPLPRLRQVTVLGPRMLQCLFTNAIAARFLQPRFFQVAHGSDGLPRQEIAVQEVTSAEEGRSIQLLLGRALPCDSVHVAVAGLRDDQNGVMDPQAAQQSLFAECPGPVFLVREITAEAQGFQVRFSEAPAADASLVSTYSVSWNGVSQVVSSVQVRSETEYFLQLADPLTGRGLPYLVAVDSQLQSATGEPLQEPDQPHEVLLSGKGAQALFVAPNPVRAGTHQVAFVDAADDTRVSIYNLEGEHVVTLHDVRGGALLWNLRTTGGSLVSAGTYVYVATDATGRATGRLVLIR